MLEWDWSLILNQENLSTLLDGLGISLLLGLIAIVASTVIGLIVALVRVSSSATLAPVRWLTTVYVEFFRNVPLIVQLFFWSFAVFSVGWVRAAATPLNTLVSNQFLAAACGLSVYTSVYIAEVFRSGLRSVQTGQREAAAVTGLSYWQTQTRIVLPQAIAAVVEPLGNQWIAAIKNTSVAMTIGVAELVFQAQNIESQTFRGTEVYTFVIVVFILISALLQSLFSRAARRLRRHSAIPAAVARKTFLRRLAERIE